MAEIITMPRLSDTMEEGNIVNFVVEGVQLEAHIGLSIVTIFVNKFSLYRNFSLIVVVGEESKSQLPIIGEPKPNTHLYT